MSRELIWVDHLDDLAKVARAYQDFFDKVESTSFASDLEFHGEPIRFRLYDEDTEWSLEIVDGAVHLAVGKED